MVSYALLPAPAHWPRWVWPAAFADFSSLFVFRGESDSVPCLVQSFLRACFASR